MSASLNRINKAIVSCEACPRLRAHCRKIANEKRRAFQNETYWGKPLPGFGDPEARLLIIGLAPAAHGANRTGRMFTGDRSGEWLYRAIHKAGFSNLPRSEGRSDGLRLKDAYISSVVKCAPPDNKPTLDELNRCSGYLDEELPALKNVKVFMALGQIALQGIWPKIAPGEPRPKFGHCKTVELPDGRHIVLSYHPSQQNTFTGRLTEPMFDAVFAEVKRLLATSARKR